MGNDRIDKDTGSASKETPTFQSSIKKKGAKISLFFPHPVYSLSKIRGQKSLDTRSAQKKSAGILAAAPKKRIPSLSLTSENPSLIRRAASG
jgi:hypothetical protein